MTNKIIDVDALHQRIGKYSLARHLEYRKDIEYVRNTPEIVSRYKHIDEHFTRAINYISSIIEELATPAPEPQQSVFDADVWCWDLDKAPKETVLLIKTNYSFGYRVTINFYGLHKETDLAWKVLPALPTGGNK